MWVPLIENNEHENEGADFFVKKHIEHVFSNNPEVDTVLLACTHYPLLKQKIEKFLPENVQLISQGDIVSKSLKDYLDRHPEIETRLSRTGQRIFYTTDSPEDFDTKATAFFSSPVHALHTDL
jgi:glutamate racemase